MYKRLNNRLQRDPDLQQATGGGLQTPQMLILGSLERNWQEEVSPSCPSRHSPSCTKQFHRYSRAGPNWSQSLLRAGGQTVQKKEESTQPDLPESLSQKWGLQNWQKP